MLPERHTVFPVLDLISRGDCGRGNDGGRCAAEGSGPRTRAVGEIASRPSDANRQSNDWNRGVAVRHRLGAHLDDPDDRQEGTDVPQPSDEKIRAAPSLPKYNTGDRR